MQSESFYIMEKLERTHWWFRVKTKLILLLIKKYSYGARDIKILDIGCGTGLISESLLEFGDIYSLDISDKALEFCSQKGLTNLYKGSISALPFENNFFDIIIALDVLEHIKDDKQAVEEVRRVLKKGGIFICFVPAFLLLWSKHDEIMMHYRRYAKSALLGIFNEKWQCLKIGYFNFFLFPCIFLLRAIKRIFKMQSNKEDLEQMPFLNNIFYFIFGLELLFLPYCTFPFGVSLMGIFKKIEHN